MTGPVTITVHATYTVKEQPSFDGTPLLYLYTDRGAAAGCVTIDPASTASPAALHVIGAPSWWSAEQNKRAADDAARAYANRETTT
jgi:hypothetical protein